MSHMPPDHAELASALRLSLLRAARRLRSQRVDMAATLSQLSALDTVGKCGPLSAGEIAMVERVQPPSMTKILAALEQSGWIERSSHPEDRRQSIIAITPAGLELLAEETRARDEWLAKRLVEFSAEDLRKLGEAVEVLDRIGSE
ncbi:MAG TPA: MarR family transcriptional regulator [Jatrophihabitans sp.]|uniref:MarR family transcriptional regulator n=1 Tax=Jatrophihabitans sp. TaxID=1932789 RepID=UPI002F04E040